MARLLAHRNVGQLPTRRNKGCVASLKYVPGAKNAKELLPSVLLNARNDTGSHRLWGKYRTYAIVLPRYRARALVQKQIPSIAGKRLQAPIAWYSVRQQAGNSEILSQKKQSKFAGGEKPKHRPDFNPLRSGNAVYCARRHDSIASTRSSRT